MGRSNGVKKLDWSHPLLRKKKKPIISSCGVNSFGRKYVTAFSGLAMW